MPSDEPSNKQSVNTGLRLNPTPGSDARRMWQDLKTITDNKGKPRRELSSDMSLPDELNAFYARFEVSNTEVGTRAPAVLDDCAITLSVADVSNTFKQVNIHKAAGQMDYKDVYSKHAWPNWQMSSLRFSNSP